MSEWIKRKAKLLWALSCPRCYPPDQKLEQSCKELSLELGNTADSAPASLKYLFDYGKQEYDRIYDTFNKLDEKANEIIKYLGGGTALVSVGTLIALKPDSLSLIYWIIPSFLASLASITYAFLARAPMRYDTPSKVCGFLKLAIHIKDVDKATGMMAPVWDVLIKKATLINEFKGKLIKRSYLWYITAIGLLILPLMRASFGFGSPEKETKPKWSLTYSSTH